MTITVAKTDLLLKTKKRIIKLPTYAQLLSRSRLQKISHIFHFIPMKDHSSFQSHMTCADNQLHMIQNVLQYKNFLQLVKLMIQNKSLKILQTSINPKCFCQLSSNRASCQWPKNEMRKMLRMMGNEKKLCRIQLT